jgi:hypothetical protein
VGEHTEAGISEPHDDTTVMSSEAAASIGDSDGSSASATASASNATTAAAAPVQQHVSDLSTMRSALAASKSSRVRIMIHNTTIILVLYCALQTCVICLTVSKLGVCV